MIKIVITIEEERPGDIRCRGAGEDVGGNPSMLEVLFTKELMTAVNMAARDKFRRTEDFVPLTFVETTRKPDEHKDGD